MPPKKDKKKKPPKGKAGAKKGSQDDPSRAPVSLKEDSASPVMEEREDLRVKS
jgi:hypothetical protein